MNSKDDSLFSPERRQARRFDTPYRTRVLTEQVYTGWAPPETKPALIEKVFATQRAFYPEKPKYNIYFGEVHGHSNLSDGRPDPDDYFRHLRDTAKLDFGTLTDHTHGGIGNDPVFDDKFEQLRAVTKKYNDPGKFSTLLGYEIEAYPYYNNAVVYHLNHDDPVVRSKVDGDFTAAELKALLDREDLIVVPHDTYSLEAGADFMGMDPSLFTPLIEIYSRADSAEYFDNPQNGLREWFMCEGGFWQDALKRGARMGCIAGSDDHGMTNGMILEDDETLWRYPGVTAVLAEENTPEAIFRALKARRCYGFMGGRIRIDFRIDGHYMGEEFVSDGDREIYYNIEADAPIDRVVLVKNCRNYMYITKSEQMVMDYRRETDADCYYLRVQLADGRCAWTSPIWVLRP